MGLGAVAAGAGIAASAASLGTTLSNDFSGGGGGGGGGGLGGFTGGSAPPPVYIPKNQPGFDDYYQTITNQLMPQAQGFPNQWLPTINQAGLNLASNPYGASQQYFANLASNYGSNILAPMQGQGASQLSGLGNFATAAAPGVFNQATGAAPQFLQQAATYGPQILQTGFDPQSALYNRTQQQVRDQLAATNAMQGLSGTPYGAGVQNQGLSNFNIDWQNAQLARQQQAAQGYGALTQAGVQGYTGLMNAGVQGFGNLATDAGRGYSGGATLGAMVPGTYTAAGTGPYSTYAGQQGDIIGASNAAAGGYANALGLDQTLLSNLQSYLGLGQAAANTGRQTAAQNFANNQSLGSGLGSALSGLSGLANNQGFTSALGNLFAPTPSTYAPGSSSYQTYSNPNLYYDPSTVGVPGEVATAY
jgi:hypothetical protein